MDGIDGRAKALTKWLRWSGRSCAPIAAVLVLAGCAYDSGGMDNPVERRLQWFSFIAGADIRAGCGPGAPDRYRLVYNGFWREQVRIYELGEGGRLAAAVHGPADLWSVRGGDLLAPWRGWRVETVLNPAQKSRFLDSLAASGWRDPPPLGARLPSDGFYWTAVACEGGRFRFNAWLFPSAAFGALSFPPVLEALANTGVAIAPADPFAYVGKYDQPHLAAERWFVTVGADGLTGTP